MPNDRARKQHIRSQQRPGESYTAALRRLTDAPTWQMDGQGMGCTEYRATIDGVEVLVVFYGDHRRPWVGWWEAIADPDADPGDDVDPGLDALTSGRYRFTTAIPDDTQVDAALAHITDLIRQVNAGGTPETVSAEHGAPAAPADVSHDGTYFVSWDDDTWAVVTVTDLRDDDGTGPVRLDTDGLLPDDTLTWQPAHDDTEAGWVDGTGTRVGLYLL